MGGMARANGHEITTEGAISALNLAQNKRRNDSKRPYFWTPKMIKMSYRVYHTKLDIRKRWHSASKSAKIDLKKRFKKHTSSGFLCKNFMSLGKIF